MYETHLYISVFMGVVLILALAFLAIVLSPSSKKDEKDYVINVQIPEEADKAIQKIAEAYRTLDRARTEHPLAEVDVQASLLEARAIVAAHLNTRISIVTSSIEKLSEQRAGHLKDGIRSYAENDLKSIRLLETELGELQAQLGRPELKAD